VLFHQGPAEHERVFACGVGQFVDEAFQIDCILVGVDGAAGARRFRRVAHRVLDQQVREAVADGVIAAECGVVDKALNKRGRFPFLLKVKRPLIPNLL